MVIKTYGNVVPAIVSQSGDVYRILSGQARLEACVHNGIQEIPVTVTELSDEGEQMKLALLLSTVREEGSPLSEGEFIDALVMHHGVTRRELMGLLKKSKSWISKRQSLALKLTKDVKDMVKGGLICARTAEEIAKLPEDVQLPFAAITVRDNLSKTSVGQLVNLYAQEEIDSALRDAILDSPLAVLDACPTSSVSRRKEKRGIVERIAGNIGFLIRLAYDLKELLAKSNAKSLGLVNSDLRELQTTIIDLNTVLNGIISGVFPGKLQGGGMSLDQY